MRGDVTFEDVEFDYGDGVAAIRNISLHLVPGTSVVLTGPSGAGKSTLVALMLRLYDPTSGRILFDGTDIRDFTVESLRLQTSLVPQETLMFRGTLAENIALGAGRDVTDAEIEEAARQANAHDFISALPDGYATEVAERGATLSAGQRQRIAIARAVLRRSPILILDEPTTGLDGANEAAVEDAIWRLAQGRTTICITHDLSLVTRADRVLFLERGKIKEDGTHEELLMRDGRYARMWRLQTQETEQELKHAVPR
jgi:ATP-binding cassette subfamily B protein